MKRLPPPLHDPVLLAIEIALRVHAVGQRALRGPQCVTCLERTRHLAAHQFVEHAEELRG